MRDPSGRGWQKGRAACSRANTPHQPSWQPGNLAKLGAGPEGAPRGGTQSRVGAQTRIQEARVWPIPLVHLSGLNDYVGIWVPDGVLDTHSIFWTAWDTGGMVIVPILQMSKLRPGQ